MLSIIQIEGKYIDNLIKFIELKVIHFSACYASKGQWQASLEDAIMCLSKDDKFLRGYYRLATAQMQLNQFDDAEISIKAGEMLDPGT